MRSVAMAIPWTAVALWAQVAVAQLPEPTGWSVVEAGARLERLFTRTAPITGGLTEGPAVAPDGSVFFSDIPEGTDHGMILRFDPRTRKTTIFTDDSGKSNGLFFDAEGRLVACEGADHGGRRISRWDLRTKQRETLVERFEGKRFNSPNDLSIDRAGRIYFTDPRYVGHEERELERYAVYRLDPDGVVVELTRDVEKPNGIALSPDGKTLYVADTNNGTDDLAAAGAPETPEPRRGAMKVHLFTLDADGEVIGPRRTLVDFGQEDGCDGMTVDVEGNLYLTVRSPRRPGVLVVDPHGRERAFIPTGPSQPLDTKDPVGLPSNCAFGIGAELNVLYVTVGRSLCRIRLKVDGFHNPTKRQRSLLETFRDEFVELRPGEGRFPRSYVRGASAGPPSARPAHEVTMPRPFSIAAYEVPQNLWEAVMGHNPSRWKGPRNSVEMLSFDDAESFCRAATHLLRAADLIGVEQVVRLPSEAEWEYAARAGTSTTYSFGDDVAELGDHGWFHGNARGNDPPVGAKKPNAWGLYDVHGYLWEWCGDPWHDTYAGAPTDGSVWTAGGAPAFRVIRGGSWKDAAELLASAARRSVRRSTRDDAIGLRCVLTVR